MLARPDPRGRRLTMTKIFMGDTMKTIMTTVAAAAIAGLAAGAGADTFDATGTGQGTSNSEPMPLADALVVVHAVSEYTGFEMANPGSPMASATGPCFGSVVINAGRVTGGGHCAYTDGDGDSWVAQWTADGMSEDGRTQGDWQIVGGTGKWQGASGGGRFDAGTDAAGTYTNNVTGSITMP